MEDLVKRNWKRFLLEFAFGMTGFGCAFGLLHHNWAESFWAACTAVSLALLKFSLLSPSKK